MLTRIFSHLIRHEHMLIRCRNGIMFWRRAMILASSLPMHNGFQIPCSHRQFRSSSVMLPTRYWTAPRPSSRIVRTDDGRRMRLMSTSEEDDSPPENKRRQAKNPREYILSRSPELEDRKIIDVTLDWIQNVVIGLNFCPFAEKPFKTQQMHLEVIHGRDETEILSRVLGECLVKQSKPGTSLMICPDLYPNNFQTFLQVYNMLNDGVLVNYELTEDVQIAPFHPKFEFDGSGSDGVDNYTNRSPYPIFHILREDEVGRAVDLLDGDASKVWRRNVELLESLGDELEEDELKNVISGRPTDATIRDKVKKILRELKRTNDIE